jgi:hypothetical protein
VRRIKDTIRPWEVMKLAGMIDLSGFMNIGEIVKVFYLHQMAI